MKRAGQNRLLLTLTVMILLPAVSSLSEADRHDKNSDTFRVPLRLADESSSPDRCWKIVRFQNVPPNEVRADKDGLHIRVQSSADLLAYCFDKQMQVRSVLVCGSVAGLPVIPKGQVQGDDKADDFAIRFGLVVAGKRKLNRRERFFASELVKRLSELVPKSQGIDHALFLNLANDPGPKWRKRTHSLGRGMIQEQIACVSSGPGQFTIDVQLDKPLNVLALCIVSDGDHTESSFQLTVNDILLNSESKKSKEAAKGDQP